MDTTENSERLGPRLGHTPPPKSAPATNVDGCPECKEMKEELASIRMLMKKQVEEKQGEFSHRLRHFSEAHPQAFQISEEDRHELEQWYRQWFSLEKERLKIQEEAVLHSLTRVSKMTQLLFLSPFQTR